ncbi:MAG: ABC transporter ATP-binding protein, partial [Bacteroidaceae bacterium]|nr:ABC transporter ATP-binding protein [Bacteroidaceae bacterium]
MASNAARKSYSHREILRWLWLVSCGLRLQSVLNAIISILLVGLDFAFISATKWAVDIATGKSEGELRWAAAILIAVVVARLIIGFSNRWIVAILGVRSQNKLQTRTFDILMQSEWRGLEERHTGDTLNRLEHDVRDITNTITDVIPSTLAVGIRLVGAFLFLYSMDRTLPFLLICISPAFVLLSKVYVNRMRALAHTIRATDSQIQSLLQESLQHRLVLKTLEQCHTMVRKLETLQQQLRQQVRHRTRFSSISALLLNMGFSTGYLVAFLWGVARLQEGSITYGVLLAFIQLVGQIQTPFREMSRYIPHLVSSLTACERLMELEATPQEETGEPLVLQQESGIRLRDVSFAYDQHHRTILQHLDYDFPPGSFTAIQGETGAGKTTLIRLILALMRPTQGCVELYNAK